MDVITKNFWFADLEMQHFLRSEKSGCKSGNGNVRKPNGDGYNKYQ